jgi:hypothetical protein
MPWSHAPGFTTRTISFLTKKAPPTGVCFVGTSSAHTPHPSLERSRFF